MDGTIEISSVLAIAAAITTVGGAWLTIRKISKDTRKEREIEVAKILQLAKEADARMKTDWEASRKLHLAEIENKIEANKRDLANLRDTVEKDMDHMRQTYNGEIRNLGEKIEGLRIELRDQHGQLVNLLTEMISKS